MIDYVDGWKDLQEGILKTIGDPKQRFRQDPVRMIRLLKFKARFAFTVDEKTQKALEACREEIFKSAPARILEEFLRMLESGSSAPFFELMRENGFLDALFPWLDTFLNGSHGEDVMQLLAVADHLHKNYYRYPVDRSILASCLIYPLLEKEMELKFLKHGHTPHFGEILVLIGSLLQGIHASSFAHFPKKLLSQLSFILSHQYRLIPPGGKKIHPSRLLKQEDFPLAVRFLKFRATANPELMETYQKWKSLTQEHARQGRHQHA